MRTGKYLYTYLRRQGGSTIGASIVYQHYKPPSIDDRSHVVYEKCIDD